MKDGSGSCTMHRVHTTTKLPNTKLTRTFTVTRSRAFKRPALVKNVQFLLVVLSSVVTTVSVVSRYVISYFIQIQVSRIRFIINCPRFCQYIAITNSAANIRAN